MQNRRVNPELNLDRQPLYMYKGDAVPAVRTIHHKVGMQGQPEYIHRKHDEFQVSIYVRPGAMYRGVAPRNLDDAYQKIVQEWERITAFPTEAMSQGFVADDYEISAKKLDDHLRLVITSPNPDTAEAVTDRMLAEIHALTDIEVYDYRAAQARHRASGL